MTKGTIGTVGSTPLEMTGGQVTIESLGMQTLKLIIGVFTRVTLILLERRKLMYPLLMER